MRWAWHIACMGERKGADRVMVEKPEGRDHLKDPGSDNIKMDLQQVGWGHAMDRSRSG